MGFGLALVAAGSASAELVARGVHDGMLALGPKGKPYVAYIRAGNVVVASRGPRGWRAETADTVARGSHVRAFEVGPAGPIALVQSPDSRRLVVLRRGLLGWQAIPVVAHLPARAMLGWPGLALDARGNAVVAYARWNSANLLTQLVLARVDGQGRVRAERITLGGFPQSYLPPPAEPVVVGKRVHVLESVGWRGSVDTFEWYPHRKTWIGLGVDVSRGDWPLGPILAQRSRAGVVYAAWTESMLGYGFVPVTLASHAVPAVTVRSEFVLDRALTTALTLAPSGPEVAANEWVASEDLGLEGERDIWAGVIRSAHRVELDGWIAGFASASNGGRDLVLDGPRGLSWFRSPTRLTTLVRIDAAAESDGVRISGTVQGVAAGTVRLYRERPGAARQAIGSTAITNGTFAFVDPSPVQPLLYRAVYTDPKTKIPYAALLRPPPDYPY